MGGRPFGFETRSKVVKPLWLNRRIRSSVKWHPAPPPGGYWNRASAVPESTFPESSLNWTATVSRTARPPETRK